MTTPKPRLHAVVKANVFLTAKHGIVSGNGFLLNMRQPGVEVFSITIDILDCVIEDQLAELGPQEPPSPSIVRGQGGSEEDIHNILGDSKEKNIELSP
jgi:hypothetical protein